MDTTNYDQLFGRAFELLKLAIKEHIFPGASVAITLPNGTVVTKAFGQFTYDPDSTAVTTDSVFDLASLTKVVATTSMAMVLYEKGLLDIEAPVVGVVPEFRSSDGRRDEITFHMLLAHSSGLPEYEKLFLTSSSREEFLQKLFAVPLKTSPGAHAEYSDVGFLILGLALERIAEETLDRFCEKEIFAPLGMLNTTFNPPSALKARIPPTADDLTFRKRVIQGEVQDENASVIGGVAGHAGLFSTAADIALFASAMLTRARIFRPETITLFTRREAFPPNTSRTLGWDTPSSPSQSGKYFSSSSFGHLGYTGTSLWIDPVRQVSVTLLTNRTWPDCSNQAIKDFRPRFHDAVMEAIAGKQPVS